MSKRKLEKNAYLEYNAYLNGVVYPFEKCFIQDEKIEKVANKISDYVGEVSEGIYYGGIPQVEDIKIKQMLLTPSEYTRPQTKIKPTAIAWHYVGNPNTTALANRNYFESLKDSHETKASSH